MAILFCSWFLIQIALTAGDCPRPCNYYASTCCTCGISRHTSECIAKCLEEAKHDCYHQCIPRRLRMFYSNMMCIGLIGCNEYVNKTTGECKSCPDGCLACFNDLFCYECIDGYYGINCNKNCSNCVVLPGFEGETSCDKVFGTCTRGCLDGYYSLRCDRKCEHCKPDDQGKVKCDFDSGTCTNGCEDGYYSSRCDSVCGHCLPDDFNVVKCNRNTGYCPKGCVDSYFGRRCDQKCEKCLPDDKGAVKCDIDTGSCLNGCIAGFFDKTCDQKCKNNCFDSNTNTNICDILSGKCIYGCVLGWYGEICNETCSGTCSKRSCSQKSGFCDNGCVSGWHSNKCEKACSNTCYDKSCDQYSGYCVNGCVSGWYGDTCGESCSSTCFNKSCDQYTGYCYNGCVSGWYGDTCGESCSNTCYNKSCDQYTGYCYNGCVFGWYGDTCGESCSSTCYNNSCDQYTGYCYNGCASAYYGETCDLNCVDTCKERVCDRETSKCLRGCVTGYQGAFCNMTMESGADSVLVSITGSLAGVIILLVFGFFLWLLRRVVLKGKHYGNLQMSTRNTAASIYDEIRDTNDKTEEHRVSESHSYMEIHAALPRSIHESGSNARNSFDDDFAANYASSLATVEHVKDTPPVCANALNMTALQSEDNKDYKSDSDETQLSSFISSDDAEVNRKGSNRSRKYYEIPDIVPGVNHNVKIESNLTNDGYEIPISSASTSDRKGKAPKAGEANLSRQCNRMTDLATSQTIDSKRTQNKQLMSIRNKEIDVNDIKQTPQKAKDDKCNTNNSGFNMEMQFETHQPQEEVLDGDSGSLNYIHPVN